MKENKIGKFITELRKERKLTQSELAEIIGVSDKSVSKWETGINIPDFSNIEALASYFNVSTYEILNGEKLTLKDGKPSQKNDNIKMYLNYTKFKYLKIIYVLIILLIVTLFTFFINNYDKNQIFKLYSTNENFSIDGFIIYNQKQNLLIINKITCQGNFVGTIEETEIKNINVILKSKDKTIFTYNIDNSDKLIQDNNYIFSDTMNSLTFYVEENKNDNSNIIVSTADVDNLTLEISYQNNENEIKTYTVPIDSEKIFSNNQFIY